MPGSKRKAAVTQRNAHFDRLTNRKRAKYDDEENRDSNVMSAKDDNTDIRKIKRGIATAYKHLQRPAEVSTAKKQFFGVSDGKFTSNKRFDIDLAKISESSKNKMSEIFKEADKAFISTIDYDDIPEELEDFPVPLESLYDSQCINQGDLGRGIAVTLEYEKNKVRRNIDISDEAPMNGDEGYKDLHLTLQAIEK
jgi:hypothetical protein